MRAENTALSQYGLVITGVFAGLSDHELVFIRADKEAQTLAVKLGLPGAMAQGKQIFSHFFLLSPSSPPVFFRYMHFGSIMMKYYLLIQIYSKVNTS